MGLKNSKDVKESNDVKEFKLSMDPRESKKARESFVSGG